MAIPIWVPGQILTSSDVNTWLVPNVAVKPSDQSITSSTTMTNDTALVLALAANATYILNCFLCYEGGTQGSSDIKWQWTVPAGTTVNYQPLSVGTTGNLAGGNVLIASTVGTAGTNGAAFLRGLVINGRVTTSSTTGNLQLQWAQNTSSGTATTVHAGSYLQLVRSG